MDVKRIRQLKEKIVDALIESPKTADELQSVLSMKDYRSELLHVLRMMKFTGVVSIDGGNYYLNKKPGASS